MVCTEFLPQASLLIQLLRAIQTVYLQQTKGTNLIIILRILFSVHSGPALYPQQGPGGCMRVRLTRLHVFYGLGEGV